MSANFYFYILMPSIIKINGFVFNLTVYSPKIERICVKITKKVFTRCKNSYKMNI